MDLDSVGGLGRGRARGSGSLSSGRREGWVSRRVDRKSDLDDIVEHLDSHGNFGQRVDGDHPNRESREQDGYSRGVGDVERNLKKSEKSALLLDCSGWEKDLPRRKRLDQTSGNQPLQHFLKRAER